VKARYWAFYPTGTTATIATGRSAEDVRRALMETVTGYCDGHFRHDATVVMLAVQ
jgi:hypothetical protein